MKLYSFQTIGLSTGGVEGDESPPEFDMGGTYGKMSPPPRISGNATKKIQC